MRAQVIYMSHIRSHITPLEEGVQVKGHQEKSCMPTGRRDKGARRSCAGTGRSEGWLLPKSVSKHVIWGAESVI